MLKIWCIGHRSQVAWDDVLAELPKVQDLVSSAISLGTHFHRSGMQTRDFTERDALPVLSSPEDHEIRWLKFLDVLLNVNVTSWHAIMVCFDAEIKRLTGRSQVVKKEAAQAVSFC